MSPSLIVQYQHIMYLNRCEIKLTLMDKQVQYQHIMYLNCFHIQRYYGNRRVQYQHIMYLNVIDGGIVMKWAEFNINI